MLFKITILGVAAHAGLHITPPPSAQVLACRTLLQQTPVSTCVISPRRRIYRPNARQLRGSVQLHDPAHRYTKLATASGNYFDVRKSYLPNITTSFIIEQ